MTAHFWSLFTTSLPQVARALPKSTAAVSEGPSGRQPGCSSDASLDLVSSFYVILFSACAVLVFHFARAVSCDASFVLHLVIALLLAQF